MSYKTQRQIAADCKVSSELVSRIAAQLKVGISGTHPNSPKTFTPADALAVAEIIFAEKTGAARNELMVIEAKRLDQCEHMARLAGLARGMQHPAHVALAELQVVVAAIRKGVGGKTDIKSLDGKARFLNALAPHRSSLNAAMAAVSAKL